MVLNKNNQIKVFFRTKLCLVVFGLLLTLVILEIGLRLGGFIILSLQERRNELSLRKRGECRVLCLGESTTQSQYPAFLEEILNQEDTGINFTVIDKGIRGTNTGIILSQLEANLDKYRPDLVVTMMGINDAEAYTYWGADSANRFIPFCRSFRIYKLIRLLWLHIKTKAKEIGIYKAQKSNWFVQWFKRDSQEITSNDVYPPVDDAIQSGEKIEKELELNTRNDSAYVELGPFYMERGEINEAEQAFKKALELNTRNDSAYVELGSFYMEQGNFNEAKQAFEKALELNPRNDLVYARLGSYYKRQNKPIEAEQAFKKALELNTRNDSTYVQLGSFYMEQNKPIEAEQAFKKALELNPHSERIYRRLAIVNGKTGNYFFHQQNNRRGKQVFEKIYNPATVDNYRKLKYVLDKRKIKWICAQYPVRSIEPLKKIFEEEEGIFFVDNEEIFKSAILREGYSSYFIDIFGGDFGHCTEKGNKLLAGSIAKAILKAVFYKQAL